MTVLAAIAALGLSVSAGSEPAAEPVRFNRDIRPILSENCFYCHGQDANKRKAELRLDEAASAHGKAVVPGEPEASPLMERIRAHDPEDRMPPPESNRRLSETQKQLLERWIREGARYETHWAFVPPERPALPSVSDPSRRARNRIDHFILAKLEAERLSPSPEAARDALIRRLHSDLIGLPPTPEEVEAFVQDRRPHAYEFLVDRLLASPHYGERMALPWLDAARYADSNGFQQDGDTWQWMWRDWVVRSLNANLPFDQFTIWQLAGDLLPGATLDQKIASGFNRNHLLNGEGGAIPEEQRFVILFDRIDTTATTWLGLTMACAQCHDHKYDPITQRDYYGMMDAFNRVPETGTPQRQSVRIRVAKPFIEVPTAENEARLADFEARIAQASKQVEAHLEDRYRDWKKSLLEKSPAEPFAGLEERENALLQKPSEERTDPENRDLEVALKTHFDTEVRKDLEKEAPGWEERERLRREMEAYRADQIPRPMVMSDEQPRDTHILDRGAYLTPLEKVSFDTPAFLPPLSDDAPRDRLGLARWLVEPGHPLTARVQVNRMWQHFFANGIVKTSEDFGVQSEYPLHGGLLDWLAVEFVDREWDVKAMHRLILTSATYRQSSRVTPELLEHDAENRLCARASRVRMPSMILRDFALASSGLLDRRVGGAPVYPYQPGNVWEPLAITKERDFTYPKSSGADLYRRSLYTFWRRTVSPANMFDASSRQACRVRLSANNTPLHALTTLNDPTWVEAARVLAERSLQTQSGLGDRLGFAFRRILGRDPESRELALLSRAFHEQLKIYRAEPEEAAALLGTGQAGRDRSLDEGMHAAFTAICLAMFNFDEALTRE